MADLLLPDLTRILRRRLALPLPGPSAQRLMAPRPPREGWRPDDQPATARQAGALVLLYDEDDGPTIALTLRRDDLPHHPGQLSFPGGRIDAGETAREAALREADEEIGVAAADIDLVGALSTLWIPVSNFVLAPFVGVCYTRPTFTPHAPEVAALVPLKVTWLTDPTRRKWVRRTRDGHDADVPYFEVGPHQLWGATAMVLAELAAVIDADRASAR